MELTLLKLLEMFQKQDELAMKFIYNERLNGYSPPTHYPVDLTSRGGQDRIRSFFGYMCEEIAEADFATDDSFPEEVSDIIHFAIEIALMTGTSPNLVVSHKDSIDVRGDQIGILDVIVNFGIAMNQLKAKPWKLEYKKTDVDKLKHHVSLGLCQLIMMAEHLEMEVYDIYFRKLRINQERIEAKE